MTGITGITYCYNAIERDYCLEECIESMQPVCDQIIVADCGSTDGTIELIDSMDKTKRIHVPFTLKTEGPKWLLKCINIARSQATTPFVVQLDADEVLHESSYESILEHIYYGRPAFCWRHNFWKTANKVLPEGRTVGNKVIRLAPTHYWMPSDEFRNPAPPICADAMQPPRIIQIGHYGFIRRMVPFILKAKAMTEGYHGQYDKRLDVLEQQGVNGLDHFVPPNVLLDYKRPHPKVIIPWLQERGHLV